MKPCRYCGTPTSNKAFCSGSCVGKWMTRTPEGQKLICTAERRRKVSEKATLRMNTDNPMKTLECRKRVSDSLKAIGWKPTVRGGNGTGPTKAEQQLHEWFPKGILNYGIKTGMKVGSGFPTCYKVDLGFPDLKLAVEADGGSHNSPFRRMKDAKKTAFLQARGWTVLRFTNQAILEDGEITRLALLSTILKLKSIHPTASTD